MKAIYLKEMRSYFHSLAAYIYFALFIAATGVYFSVICMSYGYTDYAQYVFSNSTILYIVIVPILTMRLFAEEKKQRTDQLLYTSPIRSGSIVFGKYLASVTLLAFSMLVSIIEAGVLSMFGNVNWKTVLTGCLGYFLLGACLMAVGMFVSSSPSAPTKPNSTRPLSQARPSTRFKTSRAIAWWAVCAPASTTP